MDYDEILTSKGKTMGKHQSGTRLWMIIPIVVIAIYLLGGVLWFYDLGSWDGRLRSQLPPAVLDAVDALYAPVARYIVGM
jgi:hypothetical protein